MPPAQQPSPTLQSLIEQALRGEGVTEFLLQEPAICRLRLTRQLEDVLELLYVSGVMPSAYVGPFDTPFATPQTPASPIIQFERDLPAIRNALTDPENRARLLTGCARITVADVVAGVRAAQVILRKRENWIAVGAVMAVLAGLLFLFARLASRLEAPPLPVGIALVLASILFEAINYVRKVHRDADENMAHHLDRLRHRNEASDDALAARWREHVEATARIDGQTPPPDDGRLPDPWRLTLRNMAERLIGHRLGFGLTAETGKALLMIFALFVIRHVTHWTGYPQVGDWLSLFLYGAYLAHGLHALAVLTCFMARLMRTGVLKAAGISIKGILVRCERLFTQVGLYTIVGGYLKVHFLIALLKQHGFE